METKMDSMELIIGKGRCPLANPLDIRGVQAPKCWLTSVGEIMVAVGGYIDENGQRVLEIQRENDRFLMNIYTLKRKRHFNAVACSCKRLIWLRSATSRVTKY